MLKGLRLGFVSSAGTSFVFRLSGVREAFESFAGNAVGDEFVQLEKEAVFVLGAETQDSFGRFEVIEVIGILFRKLEINDRPNLCEIGGAHDGFGGDEDPEFALEKFFDGSLAEFGFLVAVHRVHGNPGGAEGGGEGVDVLSGSQKNNDGCHFGRMIQERNEEVGLLMVEDFVDGRSAGSHGRGGVVVCFSGLGDAPSFLG